MRTRYWFPLLALGFGLVAASAAPAPTADNAEKPDAARISKLVAQLGSDDFDAREKASAELDAVGEPALDALREAVKSTDEEVHKRAETLVSAIEKRAASRNALAPRRVHLVYKDTPVKEAVEDFKKQSGYDITLHGPENKLKDRTVTLDTGDVTFWQALGRFCDKAGLKEAEAGELEPKPPLPPTTGPRLPGVPVPPNPPAPIAPPVKEGAVPAPQPTVRVAERPPPAAAPPAVAPTPGVPGGAAPGGPVIIVGPVLPPRVVGPGVVPPAAPAAPANGIVLIDGRSESLPTDARSAVRVQALPKADRFAPHPGGELQIALRLSLEPKLQWQGVDKVTVTKAVDDQKQELTQTSTDAAAPDAPVGGPVGGAVFGAGPDQSG